MVLLDLATIFIIRLHVGKLHGAKLGMTYETMNELDFNHLGNVGSPLKE